MKTFVLALLLSVGVAFAAGPFTEGAGKQITATTSPQLVVLAGSVGYVSVYNSGAVVAWVMVNTSTADLATRIAAGTAVPIAAGASFTFDAGNQGSIQSVVVASASSTALLYLGGF